jgi:hypothetical protein
MTRRAAPTPAPQIATNRVVHETPWVCWPARGGCGTRHGLNFAGGACPACGAFAVTRFTVVAPAAPEPEAQF